MKKMMLLVSAAMLMMSSMHAQVAKKPVPHKLSTVKTEKGKKLVPVADNTVAVVPADRSIKVKISTDSGVMIVRLSDSTPMHRDNFVKLVKAGFYDSLIFHRVIPGFMIQGGDPTSKNSQPGAMLGNGGDNMQRIPAEFRPSLYHKRGVLAAARDNNPEKASSACQFYLVEGRLCTDAELNAIEQQSGIKYTPEQREVYKTIGGTPFLDQNYTVFGEVIFGEDVIDKIAHARADAANRPLGDIRMQMEIIK